MSGTGSIRKLTSGRYQVRFTDHNGLRRSKGTYLTKKAATEALRLVLTEVDTESYQPEKTRQLKLGKSITLDDVATRYRELGARGGKPLSPRTLSEYQSYIKRDLAHLANKPIASITQDDVEAWWIAKGERGALSLRTKVYSHLKSLTGFALRKGWISTDPCQIRGGSQPPSVKNPVIPSVEQVELIIENAPEQYKAFFAIAAWGGLRKGELLELRRKDIERFEYDRQTLFKVSVRRGIIWLEEGNVEIRAPKWESSREVLLPPLTSEPVRNLLMRIPLDPEALLFPTHANRPYEHLGNHKLNRVWYKLRSVANYDGSMYTLRSFAGTQYAMAGATLRETMDRLGHSSAATAMRYQKNAGRESSLIQNLG